MLKQKVIRSSAKENDGESTSLLQRYGCGPIRFTGDENALYERHLLFDHVLKVKAANVREAYEAFDRSIDVHVSKLRAKLEANPKEPRYIKTVRGVGYVLTAGD